ncbi:zinc-alpha-2-glycoprotein isoform X2 [Odocoileus virginianus]|uniref:Zinc-alpha-2-glycoprotein isoform X2 n=1 Tax=Odocoileus virginianus TaxID=9874 RepID=A0ABM4HLL2_ODOVR
MEDWEKESALQRAREDIFTETPSDIMGYCKDSEGSHTFQGAFGCELRNNEISGAFWVYAYDCRDFIKFDKEIPARVPLDPAAQNTKRKWEAEAVYVQRAKAYLEEECPGMLQRYLPHSRTHLDRQGRGASSGHLKTHIPEIRMDTALFLMEGEERREPELLGTLLRFLILVRGPASSVLNPRPRRKV